MNTYSNLNNLTTSRNAVLHVARADQRVRLQLQVGHLVVGVPPLRDGRPPVALLRRQDELVRAVQENRELPVSPAARRRLFAAGWLKGKLNFKCK